MATSQSQSTDFTGELPHLVFVDVSEGVKVFVEKQVKAIGVKDSLFRGLQGCVEGGSVHNNDV